MNWLDIVIAIVLLVSLYTAFRNGLSREVVRLLALVVGVVAGMWWYGRLAGYYEPYIPSRQLAEFLAFMTFLVVSVIAGGVVAWGLAKLLGWTGLRWFDRLAGRRVRSRAGTTDQRGCGHGGRGFRAGEPLG